MKRVEVTFNAGDKNPSIADALKPLLGEDWVALQSDKVAFYVSNRDEYITAMLTVNGITGEHTVCSYLDFLRFNESLHPCEIPSEAICLRYKVRTWDNASLLADSFDNFQMNPERAPFIHITEGLDVFIFFFECFQYEQVAPIISDSCKKDGMSVYIPRFEKLADSRGWVQTLEVKNIVIIEDNVNHPSHYNRGGIECIDAMIAAKGIEKVKIFCECNDFKYDWRRGEKDPILQDAKKSRWYLDKFIELEEKHPTEIIEVDGHKYLRID